MMRNILLLILTLFVASCGNNSSDFGPTGLAKATEVTDCVSTTGNASVTGTVSVTSNFTIGDNSFTVIELNDDSTVNSTVIGKACIAGPQTNPFAYQLFYNSQSISPNGVYSIWATTYYTTVFDGVTYYSIYISSDDYPAITSGNGNSIDIYSSSGVIVD